MKTETHLLQRDIHSYLAKVDMFTHSPRIAELKVMCYSRVVKCHFDQENKPISSLKRLVDEDQPHILKESFSKIVKLGPDRKIEGLKQLCSSEDGDLGNISLKM